LKVNPISIAPLVVKPKYTFSIDIETGYPAWTVSLLSVMEIEIVKYGEITIE